jgi:hypothetical protein
MMAGSVTAFVYGTEEAEPESEFSEFAEAAKVPR